MHTPPNLKSVEVRRAPRGTRGAPTTEEQGVISPGGATTAERKPLDGSLAETSHLVAVVADAIRTLRGVTVTGTVARVLAELVVIEVPWVPLSDLGEMLATPLLMGLELDEFMVMERARNIVTVAIATVRR